MSTFLAFSILGRRGDDRLHAETNNRDRDELRGQGGSDILNVADGDEKDLVAGGHGRDHCVADSHGEIGVGCERIKDREKFDEASLGWPHSHSPYTH